MKLIGFRNSTTSLRYAILEITDDQIHFLNSEDEHALKYPNHCEEASDKLHWLHDEVCRILSKHTDLLACGIKISEYGRAEKKATRFTSHADAITILACSQNKLSISDYIYSKLPTTSAKVKEYTEKLAGKTDKYWDVQVADAIAVAYAVRRLASD